MNNTQIAERKLLKFQICYIVTYIVVFILLFLFNMFLFHFSIDDLLLLVSLVLLISGLECSLITLLIHLHLYYSSKIEDCENNIKKQKILDNFPNDTWISVKFKYTNSVDYYLHCSVQHVEIQHLYGEQFAVNLFFKPLKKKKKSQVEQIEIDLDTAIKIFDFSKFY